MHTIELLVAPIGSGLRFHQDTYSPVSVPCSVVPNSTGIIAQSYAIFIGLHEPCDNKSSGSANCLSPVNVKSFFTALRLHTQHLPPHKVNVRRGVVSVYIIMSKGHIPIVSLVE